MKGKISKQGHLVIFRAKSWRTQICPRDGSFCSDLCPLFDEPNTNGGKIFIGICDGKLLAFNEFADERGE